MDSPKTQEIKAQGYGLDVGFFLQGGSATFSMAGELPDNGGKVTITTDIDREWCIRWAQHLLEYAARLHPKRLDEKYFKNGGV